MLHLLLFPFKLIFGILYALSCLIFDIIKFFIPYKLRAKDVSKEIILVTGAGSGLGKSLAKKFAKLGATLVLWDIDERANNQTRNEIRDSSGIAHAFKCDLSNREEIYRAAAKVREEVGDVTVLVNNAGIVTGKKFLNLEDRLIEKTFQVNTLAHFWTVKAFLPNMLEKNHGHVVSVASIAGIFGVTGQCDYSASKHAAVGFDDSLRNELASIGKTGVKTTVVCPFYINTGMFHGVQSNYIPFLDQEYVTDKIVEAVLTNQEILMLPRAMYVMSILQRILPARALVYFANEVFQTNSTMNTFIGRQKEN